MRLVAALAAVTIIAVAILAVWPPTAAPEWWRRRTRPLRRLVRPRHYR